VKLEVKVHPGSAEERVAVEGGRAEIWVKARAENNKANISAAKLLAKHFKKPASSVRLVSGRTSRRKIFIVD